MTCRHGAGSMDCSSHPTHIAAANAAYAKKKARKAERDALTPDANNYKIQEFRRVGRHVALKVLYPNCTLCAHDGVKVMVFLDVSETQILKWRRIDPHFRPPYENEDHEAPTPAARFPGNKQGWDDALDYAQSKTKPKSFGTRS